ncbi:putative baseplate assembly protein [Brevibacillus humidisoli]|uniref:putative baseplate assembly protein n=1 Tax=Brevibacillus humidisoli TaxID=2895522 RepID=UPI001E3DC73B|nr:putative baseplate assembly protein [Brevibacillus humidisoli]UFJ38948.1 putative baseplate assembly protein [Brevibacillus humidisoli]
MSDWSQRDRGQMVNPASPPPLDQRGTAELVEKMKELAPYYTPEWRFSPEDPDPGTVLFLMFSELFADNIKRFNRVPLKNFVAYLNMLNVSLLPAKPARAYVSFQLSPGVQDTVMVPEGTPLFAQLPDEDDPVPFETVRPLLLTPASLTALYNVDNRFDRIAEVTSRLTAEHAGTVPLFAVEEEANRQEHSLFIGDGDLFLVRDGVVVEITWRDDPASEQEWRRCAELADPANAQWLYRGEDDWHPFDQVTAEGHRLLLHKRQIGRIGEAVLDGLESRWIKCRLKPGRLRQLSHPPVEQILLRTAYSNGEQAGGMAPDLMFHNDLQLDQKEPFYPFGQQFAPYDILYLASEEAFSKPGAIVSLSFLLDAEEVKGPAAATPPIQWKWIMRRQQVEQPEPHKIRIERVIWEYWNGQGWMRLEEAESEGELFFSQPTGQKHTLRFVCPTDMEQTYVNAQSNYWIRARILSISNLYAPNGIYVTPVMKQVRLRYHYQKARPPRHVLTLNNLAYRRHAPSVHTGQSPFFLFDQQDGDHPSLYMGFDRALRQGPLSLLFDLVQPRQLPGHQPVVDWEYRRRTPEGVEWHPLKVSDDTNGFTRTGTVQFAVPSDMASDLLFGQSLYWLRAVNRDDAYGSDKPVPGLNGMYLNTTIAVQQEDIVGEMPEEVPGISAAAAEYRLARTPVLSEEVWVDETGHVNEEELLQLADWTQTQVIRDSDGQVLRAWIRWQRVDDFFHSREADRHYVIDRASGRLRFGDGRRGMSIPNAGGDKIKVNYKTGGGGRGNVEAGHINRLDKPIPFVKGLTNPLPASGGCESEMLEQALARGPQLIKHRDRAVTAEDFEWLTRQAFHEIAKVKCLPNYNAQMERESGAVTIVILPKGGKARQQMFFPELKQQVQRYLLKRAPAAMSISQRLHVIEPAYLEISVSAVLAVKSMEAIIPTEREALAKLDRFFDPYVGNVDGLGWGIGQQLHISVVYPLLNGIDTVNHVEKLSLTVHVVEEGERTEIHPERLGSMLHGVIVNGTHRVAVNLV